MSTDDLAGKSTDIAEQYTTPNASQAAVGNRVATSTPTSSSSAPALRAARPHHCWRRTASAPRW